MANRARLAISLLALCAGGGGAWLLAKTAREEATDRSDERARAADGAARELASELARAASVARTRARSLADINSVRSAIVTNAQTVDNIVRDDQTVRVQADEGVVIAKIVQGKPEPLYAQPEAAKALDVSREGVQLAKVGSKITLWVTVAVEPLYPDNRLSGRLAIRSEAKISPMPGSARLLAEGIDLVLADEPAPGDARKSEIPLAPEVGLAHGRIALQTLIVAPVIPPVTWGAAATGAAVAIAALVWPRRKRNVDLAIAQTELQIAIPKSFEPQFGRYKVLRKLASGGMADLYLAELKGEGAFQKKIAIKHMHQHLADKPELRDWFLDEARLAAQLSHPNIVQVYELGKDGSDQPFIAMEYVEGQDLARLGDRLRERGEKMPLPAALTIGIGMCEGLFHAHTVTDEQGSPLKIVHRDMKPANVLVSHDGAVKVGDFGIAKATQQKHVTEIGTIAGTASYMAPEQRSGQAVDARADEFGVGAILYECVTGVQIDLDLARLAQLGLERWPHLELPTKLRPDLPKALDDIIFRALAYKPEQRYPDCRALQRELEKVLIERGEAASASYLAEYLASVGAGKNRTVIPPKTA
jgi:tRNA A-37 threonylcarbamoyl transferase component Bud32